MKKLFVTFVLAASFNLVVRAAPPAIPPSARESIEWCDIWISHANETNLPRVLLIGDSITRDYYSGVEKHLEGKAYVARLATSRFVSDPVLLQEIAVVLDNTKFDVIHFNNGMHGWQHSEGEYQSAFPGLLKTIRAHAPKAKLICATTTPLKESKPADSLAASDERIGERNRIAIECVRGKDVVVDDLNAPMRGHPEYHSDNVHFNNQGIDIQARQVAAQIDRLLSR